MEATQKVQRLGVVRSHPSLSNERRKPVKKGERKKGEKTNDFHALCTFSSPAPPPFSAQPRTHPIQPWHLLMIRRIRLRLINRDDRVALHVSHRQP